MNFKHVLNLTDLGTPKELPAFVGLTCDKDGTVCAWGVVATDKRHALAAMGRSLTIDVEGDWVEKLVLPSCTFMQMWDNLYEDNIPEDWDDTILVFSSEELKHE